MRPSPASASRRPSSASTRATGALPGKAGKARGAHLHQVVGMRRRHEDKEQRQQAGKGAQ